MQFTCKFELAEIAKVNPLNLLLWVLQIFLDLQSERKNGLLAEWLGGGLQNHLRRFESARDLEN